MPTGDDMFDDGYEKALRDVKAKFVEMRGDKIVVYLARFNMIEFCIDEMIANAEGVKADDKE